MCFVYVGNPVEVGITMHVFSVSHMSEVNMVNASFNNSIVVTCYFLKILHCISPSISQSKQT